MYRVYIRSFDQKVLDMFHTTSSDAARERFAELVNSTEYDGQKIGVALTRDNKQIAFHRFDAEEGTQHNWRGRTDEINLPRPVGRPTTVGGVRKNISISPECWEIAKKLGNGNASAGVSIALRAYLAAEGAE